LIRSKTRLVIESAVHKSQMNKINCQDTILLLQTDAHNYKIIGILKELKFRLSLGAIFGILIVLIFL